MKFVLDTHIHTISSGHAYSTMDEYIRQAKEIGLELIGFTDHGPEMPGASHIFHIGNQRVIPSMIHGVEILKGIEANIIDFDGNLDIPARYFKGLDIVIASLHDVVIKPGTKEENTRAIIGAMKSGYVDVIGHSGNPAFPIDKEKVVAAAKEYNVLIEINNSSFGGSRAGSSENCTEIAEVAKRLGVKVIAGSDAHIIYDLGNFEKVDALFEAIDMPEELVMNTDKEKLKAFLKSRREV